MENEKYIEETIQDVQKTTSEDTDSVVSDTDTGGDSNVEDVLSDPVTEQSEETGSENPSDSEETGAENEESSENTYTEEELEQILTALLEDEEAEEIETETVEEVPRTLFNTSLDEYTVSEGLLLCIFLLLFAKFINSIFKGSHWFGNL